MSGVTLRLNGERWREHLLTVADATPGIVPVIKGNGYGFGLRQLAEESATLGAATVGVGMPSEVDTVREAFPGDVVILNPWDPSAELAGKLTAESSVITTVSRLPDLALLAGRDGRPRVVVEVLTSMQRHGIRPDDLGQVAALLPGVRFEGWTIHLPLHADGRYVEAERLAHAALATAPGTLWFSHLPAEETAALARQLGGADADPVPVRQRVGTRLWLDRASRSTTATVLDVHEIKRGERAGYRQRVCPADGWIVVVAGGTSHGIGMEAPTSAKTVRHRDGLSRGCRASAQPVHDQWQEALVSRAAPYAVQPGLPAAQGAAAPDRTRGPGRVAADHGNRGLRRLDLAASVGNGAPPCRGEAS
jgi:Alanine racemase, N-terminal domain